MLVFLTLVAVFWAIFTHMAAELVGVPSRFRSAADFSFVSRTSSAARSTGDLPART